MLEILKFFTRKQHKDEPFEQFLADLKGLVKMCGFADQETKLLKAQIVIGIESKALQEQLLNEDISLENTILYCNSVEAAERISRQTEQEEKFLVTEIQSGTQTEPELLGQVSNVSKTSKIFLVN